MNSVLTFGKELLTRFREDDVAGLAAQLAYFFLLSLFPFMIFLLTLLGYLNIDEERVLAIISTYAPPETFDLITENITSLLKIKSGSLLSFGVMGTLWAASIGVNAIISAFNRAHHVEENRPFFVSRIVAIVLTIAMVLVICIAFLLPVLGHTQEFYLLLFLGCQMGLLRHGEHLDGSFPL